MKNPTLYIGCDAHKSASVFCAIDEDGKTVWQGERPTTREGFESVKSRFGDYNAEIVLEACSFIWKLVDMLSQLGFQVFVCDPAKNPLVGKSRKKTDPEDARKLAELLRAGYLSYVYIPTEEQRRLRAIGRERHSLVRTRVRLLNQTHTSLYPHQVARRKRIIEAVSSEVELLDDEVSRHAMSNEEIQLVMTTPGLGEYGALLVIGEICTIRRFPRCAQYLAYCGLVPSVRQSGKSIRMGATRRDSNSRLRWIYVQAAWSAARWDPRLRAYFNRKAKEKGKKKAIVAVARKLASYNYWMLTKRVTYQELVSAVKVIG